MNANDPAFPFPSGPEPRVNAFHERAEGLTIREHMATTLLAGILANPDISMSAAKAGLNAEQFRIAIAQGAINQTDIFIAELNRPNCTCREPHISDRIEHCYDGKPCFVKP